MDVPVQFFQSVIGIEVAVAGALLFEIRFFDRDDESRAARAPNERTLILFAAVIFVTVFGSLLGIANHWHDVAASIVTTGLAISVLPIILRALPRPSKQGPRIVGLTLYGAVVAGLLVLLNF